MENSISFEALTLLITTGVVVGGVICWALVYLNNERKELAREVDQLQAEVARVALEVAKEYTPLKRHLQSEERLTKSMDNLAGKIDAVLTAFMSRNG